MDATLEAAGVEILAVLKKHDIAGVALLSNRTSHKHVADLAPSWSCAKMMEDGSNIKFCAELDNFPSPDAQMEAVKNTTAIFVAFRLLGEKLYHGMGDILRRMDKDFNVQKVINPNGDKPSRLILPPGHGG